MFKHLEDFPHDLKSGRSIRTMVHKRANVLKYLKRKDEIRYNEILPKLCLTRKNVEGELIVRNIKHITQTRYVHVE